MFSSSPGRKVPTVLVVEDHPIVRMMARTLFAEAGYDVVVAENADEAQLALASWPSISILFTDIGLPGSMDGLALAHKSRRLIPALAILIVSGAQTPLDLPSDSVFLHKPYAPRQIWEALAVLTALKDGQGDVVAI
jgi:CheY-like chemotaxis protein